MDIHYSDGWFRAKKRPGELWTPEQARDAYSHRKLYAVVAGPLTRPHAFIEFNKDYVGVGFLDKFLRGYLSYSFEEVEPGRLFLTMATHREFDGDYDQVKKGTTYVFKQNGNVVTLTEEFPNGDKTRGETSADVSGNWENYPAFGEYDSLLRTER